VIPGRRGGGDVTQRASFVDCSCELNLAPTSSMVLPGAVAVISVYLAGGGHLAAGLKRWRKKS